MKKKEAKETRQKTKRQCQVLHMRQTRTLRCTMLAQQQQPPTNTQQQSTIIFTSTNINSNNHHTIKVEKTKDCGVKANTTTIHNDLNFQHFTP
eukprot:1637960-Amphidinium_carterae.1